MSVIIAFALVVVLYIQIEFKKRLSFHEKKIITKRAHQTMRSLILLNARIEFFLQNIQFIKYQFGLAGFAFLLIVTLPAPASS